MEIGKVDIAFFNKLVVEKLYIEDYHGDTLIYIDKINIAINNFNRKERKIDFGLISIDKLKLSLYKDTANLNLNVLIDSLINKDSKTEKWKTIFSKLEINNSILRYKTHKYSPKDFGMNYSDIEANKLNLTISDVQIGDTLKLDISELRFLEKSGLRIRQMKTVLSLSNKHINLDNLHISFDNSEIKANMLTFRFDSVSAFSKFNSKIRIEADFYDTEFSFTDLAFFAPQLRDFDEKIVFTSSFSGTINDLRTRNFQMVYGKDTRLRATMSLIGLPNIEHTFLYADIQEFCTSSSDIQSIQLPGKLSEQSILLPDQFDEVGLIKYKGNLTGFTNDFVAYGTISSNLGIISTDLGLKKTKQNYSFHGGIKTINFDLGKFAGPNSGLGKIDMEMQVDGYIDSLNKVIAEPNGVIHNIEFNNYIYSNVEMNGKLNGKKFEGFVYVSEPDIDLDFSGAIDFSEDIPVFDFNAVLTNARLDKLNFYKNDSLPELSFIMQSNFTGNTIDNFQGNINLWDVKYSNAKNKVTVEELSLTAYTEDSINSIKLRSGIADVSVTGQYSLKGLSKSLPEYFYHFYPSFKSKKQITETNDSLQFSIQIKESADIFDMIMPGFSIGKGSEIIGNFNSAKNILNIHGDFTNIEAESFLFNNIKLSSKNDNESLFIFLSSNSVLRSEKEFLNSINLSAKFLTDSLHTHIDWFHKDSLTYEGNLSTAVSFSKNDSCSIPKAEIELLPSTIILADSTWHLSNANFVVDRELFSVSNFMFHRAEQYFKLESSGTPLTSDTLFMQLQNIPLSNLNVFTLEKGFDLKGIINGNASLTNIFSKPVFFSDISISGFEVNKKKLGTAFVLSGWDKQNKQLKITSYTQRNKIKPFFIEGNYIPENDKLDFNIIFDRFYLSIFEPYLEKNISGLGGIISDTLQLSGSIKYPVLNG
ncbi:MAG: hypothetical protein U9R19_10055, partial [Bacteroidota bacterium]|nr:hypothetical protein [Bacteroidota bacterium]